MAGSATLSSPTSLPFHGHERYPYSCRYCFDPNRSAINLAAAGTFTLQEMRMFFLINDTIVPGSTNWNMVFGRPTGEVRKDTEGIETVRHFAANVANLVKKLHPQTSN